MIFEGNWMNILNLVSFCFHFHYKKNIQAIECGFCFLRTQKKFLAIITGRYLTKQQSKKQLRMKVVLSLYMDCHCIWKNKNKTVCKCIVTLTSYANRKVSSPAMPPNLTFTPDSPLSHITSTQYSPPSLIITVSVTVSITVFKVQAPLLSTAIRVVQFPSCWGSLIQT